MPSSTHVANLVVRFVKLKMEGKRMGEKLEEKGGPGMLLGARKTGAGTAWFVAPALFVPFHLLCSTAILPSAEGVGCFGAPQSFKSSSSCCGSCFVGVVFLADRIRKAMVRNCIRVVSYGLNAKNPIFVLWYVVVVMDATGRPSDGEPNVVSPTQSLCSGTISFGLRQGGRPFSRDSLQFDLISSGQCRSKVVGMRDLLACNLILNCTGRTPKGSLSNCRRSFIRMQSGCSAVLASAGPCASICKSSIAISRSMRSSLASIESTDKESPLQRLIDDQ
ncbi:hypothetical protein BDP55DRAFT_32677 [Colletotrichum godetiae]|uniref:Uncharacterized protein n=1 Tax=Colletotrichum godetiae TaxID=1209918 RepID=A0AAJ0ATU9_9PEZI|nr:uncharacterized protein BDP55DRAFT_32677 [Colletotrichum godetiae]KAK1688861.1 hypothetical protein BDP55DRAFT_32677 [Colletotrichum godetiae]